jgi:uncharacterized repeat protein (TIGR01451 family)
LLLAVMGIAGLVLALGATAAPLHKQPPPTIAPAWHHGESDGGDDEGGHHKWPVPTTSVATTTVIVSTPPPPPPPSSDISVRTLGAASSVFAGQNISYTTVVTNLGPSTATGVYLVDDTTGGARFLRSAASAGSCTGAVRVSCTLGTLAVGASAVVTLTVDTPVGATTIVSAAAAGADQLDPQSANNSSRAETVVLPGHAGAPVLSTPGGAFAPPLFARADGGARVVSTSVTLDEGAAISVSIFDSAGRAVMILPGSRLDYIPSGHPHSALQRMIDRGRTVPLRLRLRGAARRRYRIVVRAVAPSGESSSLTIAFGT